MKIIAFEYPVVPGTGSGEYQPHLEAEARAIYDLMQRDVVREAHFRADRHDAVLILECDTLQAAEAHVVTLPLVKAGLIRFELIPLVPYTGLERLFFSPSPSPESETTP